MDYDLRNRAGPMYPRVGPTAPPVSAGAPYRAASSSGAGAASHSSGLGIRVKIKPEYQITPPPQVLPQIQDIPRSSFKFDFEFERRILAEAEKESPNWDRFAPESRTHHHSVMKPAAPSPSSSSLTPQGDPVVEKYVAFGLAREAVAFAVLNYGDNPIKVREFVKGYNVIQEMGFTSKNVAEVLAMYDNDTDNALAYLLNNN